MPRVLTPNEIARLAYDAGFRGNDLILAVAIALKESGGNPAAYNPETAAGTRAGAGSRGLWQIYGTAHPQYNNESAFDPRVNAKAAYEVYRQAGGKFTPWSTYNNGSASRMALSLGRLQPAKSAPRVIVKTGSQSAGGVVQTGSAPGQLNPVVMIGNRAALQSFGSVTGTIGTGENEQSAPAAVVAEAANSVIDSLGQKLLGKTADGRQREGIDAAAYIAGMVLILLGLIFIFVKSGAAEKVADIAIPG